MQMKWRRQWMVANLVLVSLSMCGPSVFGGECVSVLPAHEEVLGKTLGAWSSLWWEWASSIPTPQNPLLDPDGRFCAGGQSGPVWFLVGGGGLTRTCSVPCGRHLFFPIFNVMGFNDPDQNFSCEELIDAVTEIEDPVGGLECDIDEEDVKNLRQHLEISPTCFGVTVPKDNIHSFKVPAGQETTEIFPCAAAGYYLMLEPLCPGEHRLHFRGFHVFNPDSPQEVTYSLSVLPCSF